MAGPAHHIRAWRLYRGLKTQAELAEKVGLTSQSISRLESGRMGYRQDILEKIAAALNCTPADLLGRDPNAMPFPTPPSSYTGMSDPAREFVAPRVKVDRHPAQGALKGTFTIAPGTDLTAPSYTDEEWAEIEKEMEADWDDIDRGMTSRT